MLLCLYVSQRLLPELARREWQKPNPEQRGVWLLLLGKQGSEIFQENKKFQSQWGAKVKISPFVCSSSPSFVPAHPHRCGFLSMFHSTRPPLCFTDFKAALKITRVWVLPGNVAKARTSSHSHATLVSSSRAVYSAGKVILEKYDIIKVREVAVTFAAL